MSMLTLPIDFGTERQKGLFDWLGGSTDRALGEETIRIIDDGIAEYERLRAQAADLVNTRKIGFGVGLDPAPILAAIDDYIAACKEWRDEWAAQLADPNNWTEMDPND
jgi:hypothetical protein